MWKLLPKLLGNFHNLEVTHQIVIFEKTFKYFFVVLYVGERSRFRPFQLFEGPIGLRGSQIMKCLNLDPSPIQKTPR
jgi:hypothetical protein